MLTDPVNHVDAVVEAFHQLALALRGRLDEQLAGRHKLASLGRQQLLGSQEGRLVPVLSLPGQTEHLAFPQVLSDVRHHLLGLLEHNHPARCFQSLGLIRRVWVVDACPFQTVVLVKVGVGVDVLGVPVQVSVEAIVAVNDWVAILRLACLWAVVLGACASVCCDSICARFCRSWGGGRGNRELSSTSQTLCGRQCLWGEVCMRGSPRR